jgi:cell division protein FtsQ
LLIESKNLLTRVRGLVRVGQRRWDVVLDHNQLINLPERNPIRAMKKIVLLHEGRKLLDRDISYIDFRNIDRPILGLTETSSEELKELRRLARGESV